MKDSITWEQKSEMIKLSNEGKYKEMIELFVSLIPVMDKQGYEMFVIAVNLTEIKPDLLPIDMYKALLEYALTIKDEEFSFLVVMRTTALKILLEEVIYGERDDDILKQSIK